MASVFISLSVSVVVFKYQRPCCVVDRYFVFKLDCNVFLCGYIDYIVVAAGVYYSMLRDGRVPAKESTKLSVLDVFIRACLYSVVNTHRTDCY